LWLRGRGAAKTAVKIRGEVGYLEPMSEIEADHARESGQGANAYGSPSIRTAIGLPLTTSGSGCSLEGPASEKDAALVMSALTAPDRLSEAAVLALASSPHNTLSIDALHEALFYIDIFCYCELGHKMTGVEFVATRLGPRIRDVEIVQSLTRLGFVKSAGASVSLMRLPENMPHLTPAEITLARKVLRQPLDGSPAALRFSENPGWQIAMKKGEGNRINLLTAMQQILEPDPWMDEPLTEDESRLLSSA
jgi:hypothetical protein